VLWSYFAAMPAEFLSAEQRAAYASFAEMPSLSDLEKFFFLDAFDRNVIAQSRADSHRLGVAVQIGTLRYKRLFLEDPPAVPWPVVDYLAEQLGVGNSSQVKKYAVRAQTAYDHAWMIRDAYGYHTFDDRDSWEGRQLTRQFRTFLHSRAWTHAEGPVALFEQSVAWLRRHRVLLPGVTVLERLVGSVRQRADVRMYTVVAKQVRRADPRLPGALSDLLAVPEGSRISELEKLRQAPKRTSGTGDGAGAAAGGQPGRLRAGPGRGVEGPGAADEDAGQVRGGQQGAGAGPAGRAAPDGDVAGGHPESGGRGDRRRFGSVRVADGHPVDQPGPPQVRR
jgi:hypothetical protein